jgi:hypothetical protein
MYTEVAISGFEQALQFVEASESLAASALMIPRRMRSWIRRSRSGTGLGGRRFDQDRPFVGGRTFGSARLATVPPGDNRAEDDVKAAESEPSSRSRHAAGAKSANAPWSMKHRPMAGTAGHGEGAARDHSGTVEQQPDAGECGWCVRRGRAQW